VAKQKSMKISVIRDENTKNRVLEPKTTICPKSKGGNRGKTGDFRGKSGDFRGKMV
jgi:hypothetical protein